jgi:signal transduction histidine kinase
VPAPHPIARRLHDGVMQLLGTALYKVEMCERLTALGRSDEVPPYLAELRSSLEDTVVELRAVMSDLKIPAA